MITRLQIVFHARRWVRTPYQHHGRTRGVGADCLFPLCVCEELGILDKYGVPLKSSDYLEYSDAPKDGFIHEEAVRRLLRKAAGDLLPGDLVTLRYGGPMPSHCGLVGEFRSPHYHTLTLIHCHRQESIQEHALDGGWRRRIVGAFAFPNVH